MMRARAEILTASVAVGILTGAAGCDAIWGIHTAKLYVADAGPGGGGAGGGGAGGAMTTSSSASSSATGAGGGGGGSVCVPGSTMPCYSGPAGTEGVGICQAGTMTCKPDGSGFDGCSGQVVPQAETCAGPADEDCSGHDCVQWAELFGGIAFQGAVAVAVDNASNITVAGTFAGAIQVAQKTLTAAGPGDVFVIKLDPTGVPLWGTSFGAPGVSSNVSGVAVDATGDTVVYGSVGGAVMLGNTTVGGPAVYVAKLSGADGSVKWGKGYNSTATPGPLAVTPAGDIAIGGWFNFTDIDFGKGAFHNPNPYPNAFVVRLNADGTTNWSKIICSGGISTCRVRGLAADAMGNLIVAAEFTSKVNLGLGPDLTAIGKQDLVLAHVALDGTPVLQKQIGGANATATISGLAALPTGGAVLAGDVHGTLNLGGGDITSPNGVSFVVQYAADQTYGWSQLAKDTSVTALGADAMGNILVGGAQKVTTGFEFAGTVFPAGKDVFVAKLSAAGELSWAKLYDTGGAIQDLTTAPAGEPIFVGSTGNATVDFGSGPLNAGGGNDAFVVKLSP